MNLWHYFRDCLIKRKHRMDYFKDECTICGKSKH